MSDQCTHEVSEWDCCVACGYEIERDYDYELQEYRPLTGCQGRGWYHDGSEQAEAFRQGRAPRPCPHHLGGA